MRVLFTTSCLMAMTLVTGQELFLTTTAAEEEGCPVKTCCVEDCCGPDTTWDGDYCVEDPGSDGFTGTYAADYTFAITADDCNLLTCCEGDCCGTGTSFNTTLGCCVPDAAGPTEEPSASPSFGVYEPCSNNTATQTNSKVSRLTFVSGSSQDQQLTLTTGQLAVTTETCVRGGLTLAGNTPPFNIGFVIDVSGSAGTPFGGTPTGDVNLDGRSNTILDAELAAVIAVMEYIASTGDLGNDNVSIGIISFSTEATYHGQFEPSDPADPSKVNPDLLALLLSMRSRGVTNFDDALDKTILYFQEAPVDRTNILFFLSDGRPNRNGDGDDERNNFNVRNYVSEIQLLDGLKVQRHAIGIGSGSSIDPGSGLDLIDNTPNPTTMIGPVQVTTTDGLSDALLSNPVSGNILSFELELNGVAVPGVDASSVTAGPIGFTFGPILVDGLNPSVTTMDEVKATVVIEFVSGVGTSQVTTVVTNIIPGTVA